MLFFFIRHQFYCIYFITFLTNHSGKIYAKQKIELQLILLFVLYKTKNISQLGCF